MLKKPCNIAPCHRLGGETSNWHFDNNHNITIQLYGQKDWQYIPGSTSTVASRAMQAATQNRFYLFYSCHTFVFGFEYYHFDIPCL